MSGICSLHKSYGGKDCDICNAIPELLGEQILELEKEIEDLKAANYPELAQKEIERLEKDNSELYAEYMNARNSDRSTSIKLRRLEEENESLSDQNNQLFNALSLIAVPIRPDGTWNRDRRACYLLAKEALEKVK